MRVLLDTNIWRYLYDSGRAVELQKRATKRRVEILVAPSVLYETLRVGNPELRLGLTNLLARRCWHRLMPEAYSETEEFKAEVRRLRPDWIWPSVDLTFYKRLRHDWVRTNGGFWSRVVEKHESERALVATDSDTFNKLEIMRDIAKSNRKNALASGFIDKDFGSTQYKVAIKDGGDSVSNQHVEFWRFSGERVFWHSIFSGKRSPYLDWMQDEINLNMISCNRPDFQLFWHEMVDASRMKRCWLRGAIEILQMQSPVSSGTPADSALATYLPDADTFVSADKVFISQIESFQKVAPCHVAQPVQVQAGSNGVEELFSLIIR